MKTPLSKVKNSKLTMMKNSIATLKTTKKIKLNKENHTNSKMKVMVIMPPLTKLFDKKIIKIRIIST